MIEYLLYKLSKPYGSDATHFHTIVRLLVCHEVDKDWRHTYDLYEPTCQRNELIPRIYSIVNTIVHIEHLPIPLFYTPFDYECVESIPALILDALVHRLHTLYDEWYSSPIEYNIQHNVAHFLTVCAIHKTSSVIDVEDIERILSKIKRMETITYNGNHTTVPDFVFRVSERIGITHKVEWTRKSVEYVYQTYHHFQKPSPLDVTPHLLLYMLKMYQLSIKPNKILTKCDIDQWVDTFGVVAWTNAPITCPKFQFKPLVGKVFDSENTSRVFYSVVSSIMKHIDVNTYWIYKWVDIYNLHETYHESTVETYVTVVNKRVLWSEEDSDDDFLSKPCVLDDSI